MPVDEVKDEILSRFWWDHETHEHIAAGDEGWLEDMLDKLVAANNERSYQRGLVDGLARAKVLNA